MNEPPGGGVFDAFNDIFGQMFGGSKQSENAADLRLSLALTQDETYNGGKRTVDILRPVHCESCDGAGGLAADQQSCESCDGTGAIRTGLGDLTVDAKCEKCGGQGTVFVPACHDCDGAGQTFETKSLTVTIPPGMVSGSQLRLQGQGAQRGGNAGHLFIVLSVPDGAYYTREGADVFAVAKVAPPIASDGGEVRVLAPGIDVEVRVPSRTKSGDEIRWPGYGATSESIPADDSPYRNKPTGGGKGDLIVSFLVVGDKVPTRVQERLMGRAPPASAPTTRGFFNRPTTVVFFAALCVLSMLWLALRT